MFRQRLKDLRKQYNFTQKELADKMHVDQTAISYWENGKTYPDFDKQQMLAKIFHVSVNYLLGEDTETDALKTARARTKKLHEDNPQITVDKIQNFLGVTYQTFRAWYSGLNDYFNNKLEQIADLYNVTVDYLLGRVSQDHSGKPRGVKIPVIGRVQAGIPIDAIEEILDYEEIPEDMAARGEYFGLVIRGDSMLPRMVDGDVIIVRSQPDAESGEIAVVLVNGDDATVKKIKKSENGITLIPLNPAFDPLYYSNEDIATLPVRILGKVVELRGKF